MPSPYYPIEQNIDGGGDAIDDEYDYNGVFCQIGLEYERILGVIQLLLHIHIAQLLISSYTFGL